VSQQEQETSFRDLKLDEIRKLMDSGDYEVVDVREAWERERGHIPGSRHVVLSQILANPGAQRFKDRTIFVCEVGERSAVASEMAVALGVKDVVNFRGGTKAWREAGLPLEKGLGNG
jgi:rhodanese-related sulfurtransferase